VKNEYRNISFARKVLLRKNEIKNRNNFVSSGYLNDSQRLKSYKDYFFKKKTFLRFGAHLLICYRH